MMGQEGTFSCSEPQHPFSFHGQMSPVMGRSPAAAAPSPRRMDCPFRDLDGLGLILLSSQKINDSATNWLSNSVGRPAAVSRAVKMDRVVLQGPGFKAGWHISKAA